MHENSSSYLSHILRLWSDMLLQNIELIPHPPPLGPVMRVLPSVMEFSPILSMCINDRANRKSGSVVSMCA